MSTRNIEALNTSAAPPEWLYVAVGASSLPSVMMAGIEARDGQYIKLATTTEGAKALLGPGRGRPIFLRIAARRMHQDGIPFGVTPTGTWLTEFVPLDYFEV